jgi:hypothetical protein
MRASGVTLRKVDEKGEERRRRRGTQLASASHHACASRLAPPPQPRARVPYRKPTTDVRALPSLRPTWNTVHSLPPTVTQQPGGPLKPPPSKTGPTQHSASPEHGPIYCVDRARSAASCSPVSASFLCCSYTSRVCSSLCFSSLGLRLRRCAPRQGLHSASKPPLCSALLGRG